MKSNIGGQNIDTDCLEQVSLVYRLITLRVISVNKTTLGVTLCIFVGMILLDLLVNEMHCLYQRRRVNSSVMLETVKMVLDPFND